MSVRCQNIMNKIQSLPLSLSNEKLPIQSEFYLKFQNNLLISSNSNYDCLFILKLIHLLKKSLKHTSFYALLAYFGPFLFINAFFILSSNSFHPRFLLQIRDRAAFYNHPFLLVLLLLSNHQQRRN